MISLEISAWYYLNLAQEMQFKWKQNEVFSLVAMATCLAPSLSLSKNKYLNLKPLKVGQRVQLEADEVSLCQKAPQ